MEQYYIVMLAFLAVIAVIDLFVGVSNDACNFLNSALGCRIASFRTTMWVASLGVLLGATFSSGMMEVARSGIFHPQMFSFSEIMVVFFAVMVADVILLDAFNSLGLPTSTTVSIVFELLGSAAAAAAWKLLDAGQSLGDLYTYINTSKSLGIVSGILISVVVAFISGAVIQYLARLLFSFRFEGMYKRVGAVYGAFSITAIIYFLVMKGAKGASFMRAEWIDWINANTSPILITLFVGFTILFQICISFFRINVFKIIILAGTFSLAFAFAGNDLVNFVGVPIAAWDSFKIWSAAQSPAETFMMGDLLKPATAATWMLLASGMVMVFTLWFSKKAHRVIQTSINLASTQTGEQEQFGASLPGRMIVRAAVGMGTVINQIMPGFLQRGIASRFVPAPQEKGTIPLPFDYVRASINLVLSAILIASATSLQLPLSTTYVTFMVAMGSSFADGAWDRETAVYRISGVLTVISGWFITALCASSLAAVAATIVFWGGETAAVILGLAAIAILVRSNLKKHEEESLAKQSAQRFTAPAIRTIIDSKSPANLCRTLDLLDEVVDGLLADRELALRSAKSDASEFFDQLSKDRSVYYRMAMMDKTPSKVDFNARYCYFRAFTNMREVGRSLQSLAKQSLEHVANRHRVFKGDLADELRALTAELRRISSSVDGKPDLEELHLNAKAAIDRIDAMQSELMRAIPDGELSIRGSELYLTFLLFARDFINHYEIVSMLAARIDSLEQTPSVVTAPKEKIS
ncbi:inorganic phosphate transporter [Sutterella wadsworthensis]|uniref:inorganic phosphate transporter n=4 Tax=Sutterella wadsworthensis TaxID=40545 RepID=UPI0013F64C72|nr:inorganic phosphate transporter [Sutterella wadsworthensis]